MNTITSQPATLSQRVADALTAFAGFLAQHPDLPVSECSAMAWHVRAATDAEARAEVDRIAGILGVQARENASGTHYEAERSFGPGVTYKAIAIDREAMERYSAHMAPYYEAENAATEKPAAA